MANIARIYYEHTKVLPPKKAFDQEGNEIQEEPQEQDAARLQITHQWLESTVTQDMMKALHEEEVHLLNTAISLATSAHINLCNKEHIINLLIRVNELRKITNKYGKIQ